MVNSVARKAHAVGRYADDEVVVVNDVVDVFVYSAADFGCIGSHGRLKGVDIHILRREGDVFADGSAGEIHVVKCTAEQICACRSAAVAGAPELDLSAYLAVLGKVSLYKGKRLFAADGKAGVLALEADVQIPCPLGVVTAAAQADSNDGVLLAVYADLFVCDTNAEGVASRTIREVGIRLEVLKTDLLEEIFEICRAFFVPLGVGDVSGGKAHCHGNRGEILPVLIRSFGKVTVTVGKRTRVIRLHVIMSCIEHDGACDGIVAVIRRKHRHWRYRDEQHEYQHDAECSFHFSSSILYFSSSFSTIANISVKSPASGNGQNMPGFVILIKPMPM